MGQDAHLITELNELRFELLGHSNMMPKMTQHICSRYQNIIDRMKDTIYTPRVLLKDINEKVGHICGGLDKAADSPYPNEFADVVQKSVMDLRMIIDMHLHAIGFNNAP